MDKLQTQAINQNPPPPPVNIVPRKSPSPGQDSGVSSVLDGQGREAGGIRFDLQLLAGWSASVARSCRQMDNGRHKLSICCCPEDPVDDDRVVIVVSRLAGPQIASFCWSVVSCRAMVTNILAWSIFHPPSSDPCGGDHRPQSFPFLS